MTKSAIPRTFQTTRAYLDQLNPFLKKYAKVCGVYGNIAEKKTEQVLEFEAHLLKNRFLQLYRTLAQRATDLNTKLCDATNATEVAADIAINIFKLEMEGFIARQTRRELRDKASRKPLNICNELS